ncbi:MAG: cupredoxin domain-containing protein [Solirubrobacterales bacterium]
MNRGLLAPIAVALAFPAFAGAQGTTTEIATGDNFFNPEKVSSDVGVESFFWQWGPPVSSGEHNVSEVGGIFSSGSPETSGSLTVTPSAGTFLYVCDVHGFVNGDNVIGMGGEIAVKPTATPQGKKALITWATETTDTGTKFDVEQKIGSKKPELVEEKTKAIEGAFKLKGGTKYEFRVRSRIGKATSEFSPKLKLKG